MIDIHITTTDNSQIENFFKQEWKFADMHYFGHEVQWQKKKQFIQAVENEELVGVIELYLQAGVMHIEFILVKHTHQKQGIGEMLMGKAEEIAKKEKIHKLYLETGKTWGLKGFYEKLGYMQTGTLPKHYEGQDYIEYSKFF